jgi:hypothetical protein
MSVFVLVLSVCLLSIMFERHAQKVVCPLDQNDSFAAEAVGTAAHEPAGILEACLPAVRNFSVFRGLVIRGALF